MSLIGSARPTRPPRANMAAWASAWQSSGTSSRCMAAASWLQAQAKVEARPSRSDSRLFRGRDWSARKDRAWNRRRRCKIAEWGWLFQWPDNSLTDVTQTMISHADWQFL